MRNTAIKPGNHKLNDMIASIDDGYYLTRSSNGQADSTSEFMFGVVMGYEIKWKDKTSYKRYHNFWYSFRCFKNYHYDIR